MTSLRTLFLTGCCFPIQHRACSLREYFLTNSRSLATGQELITLLHHQSSSSSNNWNVPIEDSRTKNLKSVDMLLALMGRPTDFPLKDDRAELRVSSLPLSSLARERDLLTHGDVSWNSSRLHFRSTVSCGFSFAAIISRVAERGATSGIAVVGGVWII